MKTKNEKRKIPSFAASCAATAGKQKFNLKFKTFFICFNLAVSALFVLFAIGGLNFNQARAEGINLGISTSLIKVGITPPAEINKPITLENKGGQALKVKILFKPFLPSGETGQIRYLSENEITDAYRRMLKKIFITDRGIEADYLELGPKQKKDLRLNFAIPKDEARADYYFSVVFAASDEQGQEDFAGQNRTIDDEVGHSKESSNYKNYSVLNAGIATNILLSIGGGYPKGEIEEFSGPAFLQSGPVGFRVRVKNKGGNVISPRGIIFIKNMFGQTVGRLDLEPVNVLSGATRSLTMSSRSPKADRIVWPEKFLLGPYTATLNLAVSEKGDVINKSIYFAAIPIQFVIIFIIVILIVIGIFFRIKYHLKTNR